MMRTPIMQCCRYLHASKLFIHRYINRYALSSSLLSANISPIHGPYQTCLSQGKLPVWHTRTRDKNSWTVDRVSRRQPTILDPSTKVYHQKSKTERKTNKEYANEIRQRTRGVIIDICDSLDLTRNEFSLEYWEETVVSQLGLHPQLLRAWPVMVTNIVSRRQPPCPQYVVMCESLLKHYGMTGRSNVALLVAFCLVCTTHGGRDMHGRVYALYEEIEGITGGVLDAMSAETLIEAFAQTARWRQCVALLKMARLSSEPSCGAYSAMTVAALREEDRDAANGFIADMRGHGLVPQDRVFLAMMEEGGGGEGAVTRMLECLAENNWIPSETVAMKCKDWFDSQKVVQWQTSITSVDKRGFCKACHRQLLPSIDISIREFEELRKGFLSKSLLKDDIFLNTSPSEVKEFDKFMQRYAPFHIVLDALNIYHATSQKATFPFRMNMIKVVIDYFSQRYPDKRILLLGRKHMQKWPASILHYIEKRAMFFLADDMSADDPFMTYSALYSGRDAIVVTKDELRDHRFLLGGPLANCFKRWQRTHQVVFLNVIKANDGSKVPLFRWPNKHETAVQRSGDSWHVPYEDGAERASYELPESWLCLSSKEHNNH